MDTNQQIEMAVATLLASNDHEILRKAITPINFGLLEGPGTANCRKAFHWTSVEFVGDIAFYSARAWDGLPGFGIVSREFLDSTFLQPAGLSFATPLQGWFQSRERCDYIDRDNRSAEEDEHHKQGILALTKKLKEPEAAPASKQEAATISDIVAVQESPLRAALQQRLYPV